MSRDLKCNSDVVLALAVTIRGEGFKGFFFQGRDGQTNEWVGTFEKGPENKSYKECSAATHTNNKIKDSVVLVWHAPADRGGEVYFMWVNHPFLWLVVTREYFLESRIAHPTTFSFALE